MPARFHCEATFVIPSLRYFVLAGDVTEGLLRPGMRVCLPGPSTGLEIAAVELISSPAGTRLESQGCQERIRPVFPTNSSFYEDTLVKPRVNFFVFLSWAYRGRFPVPDRSAASPSLPCCLWCVGLCPHPAFFRPAHRPHNRWGGGRGGKRRHPPPAPSSREGPFPTRGLGASKEVGIDPTTFYPCRPAPGPVTLYGVRPKATREA